MSILIDTVRIYGFRGLHNVEVNLEPFTILTGMNNSGKTSFHKALQVVMGNRQFISPDDFYLSETEKVEKIIIDTKIIPIDINAQKVNDFTENWIEVFTDDRIQINALGEQFIPIRTVITIDSLTNTFKTKQYVQQEWSDFKNEANEFWYQSDNGIEKSFHFDEIPFFYIDAQRDIIEDIKVRNSYLGKMLSKIEYSKDDVTAIEKQIEELNEQAVESSPILLNIETTLKELDTAMDNTDNGVDITPFPKKVRDLNKGVSIQYSDFSMEYHGMGTRSWSSLLTLKSFISLFVQNSINIEKPFFPIIAIEEPEAHLHPNAQKKLFGQIAGMQGQKIISTHSPYVAGSAELEQIRSFYKVEEDVICGKIDTSNFSSKDIRQIKRQVINTRGELFFSKVIVFIEGETEEQALPIFAKKHFGKSSAEIGIDFIGVGGHYYLPFLIVAESLKIPWFILSDAENTSDKNIKANVQKQFSECGSKKTEDECIIFLDDGNDYEKQLISDGFGDEIKKAIASLDIYENEQHRAANEEKRLEEIENYDNEKLYEVLTGSKTQFGPAVAYIINESSKDLPSKIIKLFDKIKTSLNIE
ncbi:MAG: AAA family ATPase [Bacteroidetes bacterium]|nr:AAA family ATPase [Bacteroidota bacterium]